MSTILKWVKRLIFSFQALLFPLSMKFCCCFFFKVLTFYDEMSIIYICSSSGILSHQVTLNYSLSFIPLKNFYFILECSWLRMLVIVSKMQQRDWVIQIHVPYFSNSFHLGCWCQYWAELSVLFNRSWLVIHFK